MSIFQKIRNLFGLKTEIHNSPIEALDKLIGEKNELSNELKKAQDEFDETSDNLELKILACDKVLEKGENETTQFNKRVIAEKLDKLTNEYIEQVSTISKSIQDKGEEIENLESDILQKSIEVTAILPEEDQKELSNLLRTWEITGIVKAEEEITCDTQLKAIVTSLDVIMKASDIEEARVLTIPEEPEDLTGHYSNVIVKNNEGKILFLKRANNKVIAPGQYCLPGGHIDKGETIEEAGLRELKEEAGLKAKSAYIIAKAKCENGKWAFYMNAYPEDLTIVLETDESINVAWMDEDEWMAADLIFDLKDHMRAIEAGYQIKVKDIPEIKKGEEALLEEESDILIKGRRAQVGEKRSWSGIEYVKTDSKWIKTKDNDKERKKSKDKEFRHTTEQLTTHAENTSSDQLKKISVHPEKPQHLKDAAKRELERRAEKDKKKDKKTIKKAEDVNPFED